PFASSSSSKSIIGQKIGFGKTKTKADRKASFFSLGALRGRKSSSRSTLGSGKLFFGRDRRISSTACPQLQIQLPSPLAGETIPLLDLNTNSSNAQQQRTQATSGSLDSNLSRRSGHLPNCPPNCPLPSNEAVARCRLANNRVILNVGGTRYE